MVSYKEQSLDSKILASLDGNALAVAKALLDDVEVHTLQNYANSVSIKRLHFNDHGPVHMRQVAINALNLGNLLIKSGIEFSLPKEEESATVDDSKVALVCAALLHDVGMSMSRKNHEESSIVLANSILTRILQPLYIQIPHKAHIVRALALEAIAGHMGNRDISSIEAGIILVADGCDMCKGRARIPMAIKEQPSVGDIHKYSSLAIEAVSITQGEEKPINITIRMSASVGFFQVEEVLLQKIASSTIKPFIELYAFVEGRDIKKYL